MSTVITQSTSSLLDKESYGKSYAIVSASTTYPSTKTMVHCGLDIPRSFINSFHYSTKRRVKETRKKWRLEFALGIGQIPNNGDQDDVNEDDAPDPGQTRLSRIVSAAARQLLGKFNSARKNFPMKIFLLLFGFYTANALATILGQTGDWDVLVAGVVVAAIEGIGMLMYKKPPSLPGERLQMLISMVNYWKAGVCLGLFVDAFKLGS
ncbi:hypothetical protein V2J09_018362 [Rumex salicifolius]